MNPLLFFIFICAVASVCFVLGHRIGYLTGKAEVSDMPRGESYLSINQQKRPPPSTALPLKRDNS